MNPVETLHILENVAFCLETLSSLPYWCSVVTRVEGIRIQMQHYIYQRNVAFSLETLS